MIFLPFGLRRYFGAKSRIRGARNVYDFKNKRLIDSIIFFPFELRSLFGAKNQIREGCQKWGQRCSRSNILKNRKESECQKRGRNGASAEAGATILKNREESECQKHI